MLGGRGERAVVLYSRKHMGTRRRKALGPMMITRALNITRWSALLLTLAALPVLARLVVSRRGLVKGAPEMSVALPGRPGMAEMAGMGQAEQKGARGARGQRATAHQWLFLLPGRMCAIRWGTLQTGIVCRRRPPPRRWHERGRIELRWFPMLQCRADKVGPLTHEPESHRAGGPQRRPAPGGHTLGSPPASERRGRAIISLTGTAWHECWRAHRHAQSVGLQGTLARLGNLT